MGSQDQSRVYHTVSYFADGRVVPDLMSETEVIEFLRISQISNSKDYHNVIRNLIRFRDLPRIQICNKLLFPKEAVLEWINIETIRN